MREALQKAHAARRTLVTITCSCGWWGEVGTTADCPTCGANEHARVNKERAAMLERLSSPDTIAVGHIGLARCPLLRRTLLKLQLIAGDGVRAPPGGNGTWKPKGSTYKVTERGELALAAYRAMKEAELKRKVAGETARRHADLSGGDTARLERGIANAVSAVNAEMPLDGWRDRVIDAINEGMRKPTQAG